MPLIVPAEEVLGPGAVGFCSGPSGGGGPWTCDGAVVPTAPPGLSTEEKLLIHLDSELRRAAFARSKDGSFFADLLFRAAVHDVEVLLEKGISSPQLLTKARLLLGRAGLYLGDKTERDVVTATLQKVPVLQVNETLEERNLRYMREAGKEPVLVPEGSPCGAGGTTRSWRSAGMYASAIDPPPADCTATGRWFSAYNYELCCVPASQSAQQQVTASQPFYKHPLFIMGVIGLGAYLIWGK